MIALRRPLYAALFALSVLLWSQVVQAAPSSLHAMALRQSELAPGFAQESSGYVSNAVVARSNHVSQHVIDRLGRLNGYEVDFARRSGKGACCLWNAIVEYKSARSAAAGYRFYVRRDRRDWHRFPGYKEWTSRDGKTFVYAYQFVVRKTHNVEVEVETYRGSYLVTVGMDARVGALSRHRMIRDAMHYTEIVLRRV